MKILSFLAFVLLPVGYIAPEDEQLVQTQVPDFCGLAREINVIFEAAIANGIAVYSDDFWLLLAIRKAENLSLIHI